MENKKQVRQYWDNVARDTQLVNTSLVGMLADYNLYNAIYRDGVEKTRFSELVKLKSDMHVVEIGCGGGRWLIWLASKVNFVHGTDVSEEMIALSSENCAKNACENVSISAGTLPSAEVLAKADLVYLSGVCMYMTDVELHNLMNELYEQCKIDVTIISRDTLIEEGQIELFEPYRVIYRNLESFKKFFTSNNWKICDVKNAYESRAFSGAMGRIFSYSKLPYAYVSLLHSLIIFFDKASGIIGITKYIYRKVSRKKYDESQTEKLQKFILAKKNDARKRKK